MTSTTRMPQAGATEQAPASSRRRTCLLVFACVAVPLMALYAASAGTWPKADDAGELMTAAARLGIAHPSGYPLLTLMGKAATYLPVGTVAYRLNLLVGLIGATACGLLGIIVLVTARSGLAGVLTGLAFGVSPVVWGNSTNFEVYALNALFVVVALLCATLAWHPDTQDARRGRWLYLLASGVGLGVSHHLSFVAALPAPLLIAWSGRRRWMPSRREVVAAASLFLLGLTPWLYLPIRAWYFPDNPETCWTRLPSLRAIIRHMSAQEYRGWLLTYSLAGVPMLLQRYLDAIWQQFGPLLGLVPFGIVSPPTGSRGLLGALAVLLGLNAVLFLGYVVEDYQVFYIPSYVVLAVCIGFGMRALAERAQALHGRIPKVVLAAAVGATLTGLTAARWGSICQHGTPFTDEYTARLEQTLPPNAVVILASQWSDADSITFPVLYARQVEGRLRGVTWESAMRLPSTFSVESMGQAVADEMTRELIRDIGMSGEAAQRVMAQPAAARLRALMLHYDSPRPLFTDSPTLLEDAGYGIAYCGYIWGRLPEPGCTLEADPDSMRAWVAAQASRPEADQTVQDNLSLPLINFMHYLDMSGDRAQLAAAAALTADTLPKSQFALHVALDQAIAAGVRPLAWQILDRLQAEYPYHADSYIAEADLLLREHRYQEALRAVNRGAALSMEKRDQITITRALCHLGMGDAEKAREMAGPRLWPQVLGTAATLDGPQRPTDQPPAR